MEVAQEQATERKVVSIAALGSPIRFRILEVLTEWGPLSPNQIVLSGMTADIESMRGKKTHKKQLSHIAYHCRQLEQAHFLRIVDERPVRGASMEHFYEADHEAVFSNVQWAALSKEERESVSGVAWRRFIPQVEAAMRAGTFDSRLDRMLGWGPLWLHEEGWRRMAAAYADLFAVVEEIRREAEVYLEETGEDPIRAIYGMFAFEAPQLQKVMPDGLRTGPPGISGRAEQSASGESRRRARR